MLLKTKIYQNCISWEKEKEMRVYNLEKRILVVCVVGVERKLSVIHEDTLCKGKIGRT